MPYNDPLKNSNLDNLAASAYALEHLVAKNKEDAAKVKKKEEHKVSFIGCGILLLGAVLTIAVIVIIVHFIIKVW